MGEKKGLALPLSQTAIVRQTRDTGQTESIQRKTRRLAASIVANESRMALLTDVRIMIMT